MTKTSVSFNEVEAFVRFVIQLGGIYTCDADGYVVSKSEEAEPALIKIGTQYKRLMVMKETITDPDALILNPLNENVTESPEMKFLYTMLSIGLARRAIELFRFTRTAISLSSDTEAHLSTSVMKFASRHKDLDEKAIDFFEIIAKDKVSLLNVWYNRKLKEARFRCSLYDPDTRLKFPSVTKKAWNTLTALMSDVLSIDKDPNVAADQIVEKYSAKSMLITSPKLESVLEVYLKLYQELNPYFALCEMDDPDFVVDLTSLGAHILKIPAYYEKTKWFTGSGLSDTERPAVRTIEAAVDRSHIPPNANLRDPQFCRPMVTEPVSGIPPNPAKRGNYFPNDPGYMPQSIGYGPAPSPYYGGGIPPAPQQQPMFCSFNPPAQYGGYGGYQSPPVSGFSIPIR